MKQAIIIGGGPAGLTAAYELAKGGAYHPVVLERDAVLGGLARTVDFGGNRMDIGGHRFFTKSAEVQALWDELLPTAGAPAYDDRVLGRPFHGTPGGADPERADRLFLLRHRISRILYNHHFFDYPVSLNARTIRGLGLARMMAIGCSYLAACVHKREEITLEDFMVNRFGRALYETFFAGYTEKVWGKSPAELGADWGSQRIRGISLAAVLKNVAQRALGIGKNTEASLIEEFRYPKYGPGQLFDVLAEKVTAMGGEIVRGADVLRIEPADGAQSDAANETVNAAGGAEAAPSAAGASGNGRRVGRVIYRTADGAEHALAADVVLSSMPVKDLVAALPSAWFSDEVRDTAAALPYRDFMTAGLLVDRLLLKNETPYKTLGGIVPDCWIYIQEPDVRLGRLQVFNNWSPYLVRDPEHTVWLGLEYFCQEGDALWTMADDAFLRFATEELERIHVIAPGAVKEGHVVRMQKAYPAYYGSYEAFPAVRAALDTIHGLWCIGRNGQHRYNNMDHSMLTALEAVRAIHHADETGVEDKTALWDVNTETDYHETRDAAKGADA
ncbi:NAD(P)/FAD-dependent oxidoreductase [Selenomonas sp.]|uniref:NAD(P)/FAD-dependent oxidoreductase n=1 Tax=Selenomonas sp. TaxID=2053611 RepID=UPI0025ECD7D0|nr:NAD(P)/FAD-dependent oxidoreductase [Selenomonas sp.]MCI6283551.1 NAD(P)/FAD-dependent oxidoreductase [Selenomonas sp.]